VNPQDFLDTASALAVSSKQSDLRTSVSRSYYAVVLFYRNYFAKKLGFFPERLKYAVHKFVPECFSQSDSIICMKMGETINRIKADRTKADYILSKTISPTKAEDCLKLAQKLIANTLPDGDEEAVLEQARTRAKAQGLIT